jgi:hypothetical protein
LKTVNSGKIQAKFTEIQSKEEKKKEQKQEQTTKEEKKKLTEDLQFEDSSSRLQAPTGDSIMSEEKEEKCQVLKTPATLRSKARDDYEADLQAAD